MLEPYQSSTHDNGVSHFLASRAIRRVINYEQDGNITEAPHTCAVTESGDYNWWSA